MRINTTQRTPPERVRPFTVCGLQVYRAPRDFHAPSAAAGFDYVFIDMEHGSFNLENPRTT